MNVVTLSNLYPRPDRTAFGMFNAQLFREMATFDAVSLQNVCIVPEWRVSRWRRIQSWQSPCSATHETRYAPVFYMPIIGRNWSPALYMLSLSRLRHDIAKADVVFASWLYPDGDLATRLARHSSANVWVMVLGSDTFHLEVTSRCRQIMAADKNVAGYVCVCQPVADRLVAAGIAHERVHVVPNGVDASVFHYVSPGDARDALRASTASVAHATLDARRYVLFVGNLVPVKGPDLCLDAFIEMSGADEGAGAGMDLVFLGQGPMKEALCARAQRAGVRDRVHFLGSRPHAEIVYWMSLAACLCLSSRAEGMPNVVLEALAAGLPVVATDVGACREMLAGEPAGAIVASDDRRGLARAMVSMLATDVDRSVLAARHGRYSWRDQAEKILNLIQGA